MRREHTMDLALAVGGPALLGACLGLPFGIGTAAARAASLPAIVLGVAVVMLPALYILGSLTGFAPRAEELLGHALATLRRAGLLLAGAAPAALFLLATAERPARLLGLAVLMIAFAMVISLRTLRRELSPQGLRIDRALVYWAWALVTLALGARFLVITLFL